tara:strand:- start:16661 stop:16957 length:297 start_codon:yes stop_codon:yes gene_type:complete
MANQKVIFFCVPNFHMFNISNNYIMNIEHQQILKLLTAYLNKNPELRFTQALFNLDINQKPISKDPFNRDLRDNYGDKDSSVLHRIVDRLEQFEKQNN